jgi:hypothetical protein
MSDGTAAAPFGSYLDEPPLSPNAPNGLRIAQPAEEMLPPPAPPTAQLEPTSLEALLVRYGLVSSEQMAFALGERIVTGKDVATIALEKGWVTEADLAQVRAFQTPAAPIPVQAPMPVAPPPAAPVPAPVAFTPPPAPTPTPTHAAALFVRLANGERIPAGSFATPEQAMNEGRLLALRMGHEGEWPFLDGRYVRPEAVVSIDVETLGL